MIRRRGARCPNEFSSRIPVTMPNPSGSTMTTKSLGRRPSESVANPGPSTPSTPISDAAIAR